MAVAAGVGRRDEGAPALLASHDPLGLEPGIDRARRVHVHGRLLGKLANARHPVAGGECAVLDRRPDAGGELRAERNPGPAVDAEIELARHAATSYRTVLRKCQYCDSTPDRMVRATADRVFLPTKNLLEQVGDMMILTGKTLVSALRPPYPYGTEFVQQFLFMLRLCWMPLTISMLAVSYGAPGLQAGNFLILFGAIDRLGGFFVLASIREFAPLVTAIILAGVGGTAITADLGARKIREELDALQVLGVDPIKNLVVPRFLALMIVTGLFNIYAIIFGLTGGVLATLSFDAPLGPFFASLLNNASTTDLWGSVVKTALFGAIIAIVSCYKGMTASGGAEGVGRAVNQGVVIEFLGIFAFNYVFTQTLLATHPEISVIK